MANSSVYDDQFLTEDQRRQVQAFKEEWERANASGNQAGMDAAHAAAERVRAQANYSGGADGGSYYGISSGSENGVYTPATLPSYQAQTDAVNRTYDAAREAALAGLKTAYDQNNATLEAQRAAIPERYQVQRNAVGAQAEVAGRNFNEYAAASGLNSGTGGQAALARSNQLQGDLSALSAQEAAEQRDLENQISQLKVNYQNQIAQAVAEGEYQRAAALMGEYQRAAQSAVDMAQAQADENYRAWQAGDDVLTRRSQAERTARSEALSRAQALAEFGDFSGYRALGYSDAETEQMRRAWVAKEPRLAYDLGVISAEEYERRTGKRVR